MKAPTLLMKRAAARETSKDRVLDEPFEIENYSRQSTAASAQCTGSGGTPSGSDFPGWHSEASEGQSLLHEDLAELCKMLARVKEGDARKRESAVEALREAVASGGPKSVEAMAALSEDESPWVRQAAVYALGYAPEASRVDAVNAVMPRLRDSNPAVRSTTVQVLGRLSPEGRVPATLSFLLEKLAQEEDSILREALVAALVQVAAPGDRAAISALANFASDFNCWVRLAAAGGLGKLAAAGAGEEVLAALCGCAADGSWQVREAAADALGRIQWGAWKEAAYNSAAALQRDKSPRVREAAIAAVEAIAAQPRVPMQRAPSEVILEEPEQEAPTEGDAPFSKDSLDGFFADPAVQLSGAIAVAAFALAFVIWGRRA